MELRKGVNSERSLGSPEPRILIWCEPQVYATSAILNRVLKHLSAI